jgi:hypothetical protein
MAQGVCPDGVVVTTRIQDVTGELLVLVRHDGEGVPHERNGPRDAGRLRHLFWWPEWMVKRVRTS